MKHSDVKIGEKYLTRVGPNLVLVRVVREIRDGGTNRRSFVVERAEGTLVKQLANILPKPRTAAALRPYVQAHRDYTRPLRREGVIPVPCEREADDAEALVRENEEYIRRTRES